MENLTSRNSLKNTVTTSKNRQGTQGIELRQHRVDPVAMLRQYNTHLPFKTLRELRDCRQTLLDRENRVETRQIALHLVNPFTCERKQLLDARLAASITMTTTHEPTRHIHVEGSNVSCGHEGEIDDDGYLIAQHYETNQFSHTREIKELEDHLEIVQQDSRCLQLEELKSKETVRLATDEELRALLEASAFDGKDEVELGTEITVEGFTRVEQTHEETAADVLK